MSLKMRIGVISDTHNLLRLEVKGFLEGADHILHAGDICSPNVLDDLKAIAPVTAVRGNNDKGDWVKTLNEYETVQFNGTQIYLIHDIKALKIDPQTSGIHIVIFGHSHKPQLSEKNGIIFLNPGSAGPKRFTLPIAAAEIFIQSSVPTVNLKFW